MTIAPGSDFSPEEAAARIARMERYIAGHELHLKQFWDAIALLFGRQFTADEREAYLDELENAGLPHAGALRPLRRL